MDLSATSTGGFAYPLILTLVFFTVVLLVIAIGPVVITRTNARRRLPIEEIAGEMQTSLRKDRTNSFWSRMVQQVEQRGLSLTDTNTQTIRARLMAAGYTHPEAPRIFVLIRLLLAVGLPAVFLLLTLSAGNTSWFRIYAGGSLFGIVGLYLPNLFVSARASRRKQELVNSFPDGLDLMLVCVEAGLGLDAAFTRVGAEMAQSHPLLSEQLAQMTLELRAGRSREEALRRLAERAGVEEIRSFTTLLIQSEKLGSSVGHTLRIYAAEMRERRRMRAEEKAHRLPVLLSIPLVCFMLPTMIGVIMLPAAIRFMRQVMPALGG